MSGEEFQAVLEAARIRDAEMAEKVSRQFDRGIITNAEYVVKLAEIAGWV